MEEKAIDLERVPAFALLFHLGKMTMRPGGMELTRQMLDGLQIGERDQVVELAPGRGATTRMVLELSKAQATGLEDGCASVVFGEAMLTMQTRAAKLQIAKEAFRLLKPGGRYGIHETCLVKHDLSVELKSEMEDELREALHVGARPLHLTEWRELLEEAGFSVRQTREAPMHLLEPRRMIQDEGFWGAARFALRVMRSPAARRRILRIRRTFNKYSEYINAAALIAVRPG
jgi:cyclopropane fatty-acyl-phospholipid synthase-like methyltransferase